MATEDKPKYVYGVLGAATAERVDGTGIGGLPLSSVSHDRIAALTSDLEDEQLEAGRDELLAHAHALEHAFKAGAVLPMRFGVVLPDAGAVRRQLLAAHREALEEQLAEMEDRVEINVKGIYEEEAILREVVLEDPELAELKRAIGGGSEDATYPERIRLGELVAEALEAKRAQDGDAIVGRLSAEAVAIDVGDAVHERMAVSCSFLVERSRLQAFDRLLDTIAAEQAERIQFKYTGPLPPHSFVELTLEA
jgi:gas vesicle protein GvpL/GvpF